MTSYWLTGLVLAPVLEEVVFRHGLQAALRQRLRRVGSANVLTACAFGLAHLLVQQRLAALWVALPALAIGHLYQRTGRLVPCVALHAAMNAVWLAGGQVWWHALPG